VFGVPRSTVYAAWKRAEGKSLPARPGPKPALDDDSLVGLIREDLAASIFTGEGHRKVWARLRYGKGLRVSRHRVLRLMRENNLLAPCRPGRPRRRKHDGTLVTEAPNLMWCGDGTKFYTLEEGWCVHTRPTTS
jgi:transposase InsO family protein